jgi:DNA-binding MarR family transcriptional regulator
MTTGGAPTGPEDDVQDAVVQDALVDAVLGASRVLVAVAARSLGDVGEEVTLTQYRTLVVLASRGPQRLAELAEAVDVTPPTASRMCDRLVRKGLIARRHERGDRRLVRLSLADKGRELVAAVTARRRTEIATLLAAVPAEQRSSLIDSLQRLASVAGEVPEQDWSAGWDL